MYKGAKSKKHTRKSRTKHGHFIGLAKLRLFTAGAFLLSMLLLIFMSSGSTARRMMQFALPLIKLLPEHETEHESKEDKPITIARVDVDAGVGEKMRIEVLSPKEPVISQLGGVAPRILIYHTHTTEAYAQVEGSRYEENGAWRTKDESKSIVAVGALLAKILREQYGCNVIHDKTDHEPPKLATSYNRSVETMLAYKEKYPSLTMFIDVHRDAGKNPSYVILEGKRVARMMFVVGTGEGATGTGFKEMPDFQSNYALAHAITEKLLERNENLMRNIRVKTGRYNQHVSNQCLLVEMGDNANTLEEALNAVPYLARAIVDVMNEGAPVSALPIGAVDKTQEEKKGNTGDAPLQWAPAA